MVYVAVFSAVKGGFVKIRKPYTVTYPVLP